MTLSGASVACHSCGAAVNPTAEFCPVCDAPQGTERTTVRPALGDAPPAPVEAPLLGGKWKLGRQLGKGGMGAVFLAHDLELDRQVAIKMLAENLCDDTELVQRFEREARMMAKLDHPNLVPVYAVGRHENVPFIVMKMLEGLTLHDTLKEKGALELDEAMGYVRQMCAGLQFVHDRNVVHRDIKPANIFIAPDGHVTLLDLGVARESSSNMTRSGVMVGTPRYMAPEQVLGKPIDHRADIYALATVVYEMLTGRAVFQADSDFSVMRAHIDEVPVSPVEFVDVPVVVANALLKGLAKDREERFQSAREFLAAMENTAAVLGGETRAGKSVIRPLNVTVPPRANTPRPTGRPGKNLATPLPVKPRSPTGPLQVPRPVETRFEGGQEPEAPDDVTDERPPDSLVMKAAVQRGGLGLWVGLGFVVLIGGTVIYALLTGNEPKPLDVVEKPIGGKPIASKPVADKPVADKPVADKPVADKPVADKPVADKPVADKPVADKPVADKPIADKPVADKPVADKPVADKPVADKPVADKPVADKPVADKPVVAALRTGPAQLRLTTTAGGDMASAYVDVDGIRKGSTPLVLKLDPGKHELVFRRSGSPPITRELTVSAGETKKLTVEMTP